MWGLGWQGYMELGWAASRERGDLADGLAALVLLPAVQGRMALSAPLGMEEEDKVGSAATAFSLLPHSWKCHLREQPLPLQCFRHAQLLRFATSRSCRRWTLTCCCSWLARVPQPSMRWCQMQMATGQAALGLVGQAARGVACASSRCHHSAPIMPGCRALPPRTHSCSCHGCCSWLPWAPQPAVGMALSKQPQGKQCLGLQQGLAVAAKGAEQIHCLTADTCCHRSEAERPLQHILRLPAWLLQP